MNKEFINKKGVFQSVQDHHVEEAKVKAKERLKYAITT